VNLNGNGLVDRGGLGVLIQEEYSELHQIPGLIGGLVRLDVDPVLVVGKGQLGGVLEHNAPRTLNLQLVIATAQFRDIKLNGFRGHGPNVYALRSTE